MDTKLTLNIDKVLIDRAKAYAKMNKISLSKLFENYLSSLVENKGSDTPITPLVKSLSGVVKMEENEDLNQDYTDYLIRKYQ